MSVCRHRNQGWWSSCATSFFHVWLSIHLSLRSLHVDTRAVNEHIVLLAYCRFAYLIDAEWHQRSPAFSASLSYPLCSVRRGAQGFTAVSYPWLGRLAANPQNKARPATSNKPGWNFAWGLSFAISIDKPVTVTSRSPRNSTTQTRHWDPFCRHSCACFFMGPAAYRQL
jgi:hypothetical protein